MIRKFLQTALAAVLLTASANASLAQSAAKFEEPDEASLSELMFASMDVNFSGLLTKAEMAFYFTYVFLTMDDNDDGRLSDDEFALNYSPVVPVPIEELSDGEALIEAAFMAYDADKDEAITQDEFVARYLASFAGVDSDQSGALTLAEFENHSFAVEFGDYERRLLAALQGQ